MLSFKADDFLIGSTRGQRMEHVSVIPKTAAAIPRGTVLAKSEGGYTVLTSSNVDDAEVILAKDVEKGDSAVTAPVYVSGDFIEQGMTADEDLTDAARLNLKRAGIYLKNGIE